MSLFVRLLLKDPSTSKTINELVEKTFGEKTIYFATAEDNQAWLDEINNDPKSSCAHLKPKDRDFTMEELKKCFKNYTTEGLAEIDIGFGRTPEETMEKTLSFIDSNRDIWQEIRGIHDLVERSETGDKYTHLLYLDHYFPDATYNLPKTHLDYRDVYTGGCVAYITGMNDSQVGVVYGNVESPTFLKSRTTIDPGDSNLIKDDKDRHILLMPLIPMDENAQKVAVDAYNRCVELYFQEPMGLFMAKVYPQIKPSDGYNIDNDEAIQILELAKRKCKQSAWISHFRCDELIDEYASKRYNITSLSSRATKLVKQAGTSLNEYWWFLYAVASLKANKYGTAGEISHLYRSM